MISILLASYNGEKYIAEQIDSLLAQKNRDFKLFINDDKSTDNTYEIISEYAEKYPEMIFATQNEQNSGGAKCNFIRMMIEHKDDYVMLCDQDDIWLPDKIEISLAKIKEMETIHGMETPLLVHTDLHVVNETLKMISPSYKIAMNADYSKTRLRNQIIQNTLTGCTVIYNRALSNLVTEIPQFMVMHDWWLMLIAAAFGKVAALDEQTVLYRQHGSNDIGAKDVRTLRYKINKLMHSKEVKKAISDTYLQAQSFINIFRGTLTSEQQELLTKYCDIPNHIKPIRWFSIYHLGTLKNGISRKIAHFIYI